jgi:hypothetical protein
MRSSRAEDRTVGNDSGGRIRRVPIHDGWAPYYRFLFAFHQSCLPVCRSAAARWRRSPRLGRNRLRKRWSICRRGAWSCAIRYERGEISGRGLRIATWKAGGQPGPDPGNTAPQPGKSGLFPISGWCLACRTSRTAGLDRTAREPRTACRGARSRRNRHGRERDHYRTLYFSHSGKYSSGSVWCDARFRADNSGAFVNST